jgi:hypothetical protein
MKDINIKCPCCNKDIVIKFRSDGDYSITIFNEKITEKEAFDIYGICFGVKGGDNDAK